MSKELVKEWIAKAEEDYWAAKYLSEKSKEKLSTVICFHAQQCAEKYLKALCTKHDIEPPKIHSLETLLDILVLEIPELEEYRESLTNLTPYSVEYRYPGIVATTEDVAYCMKIIQGLRKVFRQILAKE